MILNEIKCHVNTSLGLMGGCIPCIPPVSAPADLDWILKWNCEIGFGFEKSKSVHLCRGALCN